MNLANVNTDDIGDAIRLGCRTMCSVFNADDDDVPFFASVVWPEARLDFNPIHSESHVPGRHLNALLSAQAVLDVNLDETCIEKHARAAFLSYSGPVALPLNRERIDGQLVNFVPHNIREGMHALYALVRYRDSSRARTLAERSIDAIDRLWQPARGWDRAYLEDSLGLKVIEWDGPFITGIARAIGPLVKYYRATGYTPALQLAQRLKKTALDEYFLPDGSYDRARFGGHTHSTTCTLSGLAQLAELTDDDVLKQRVRAFYDHGLPQISDQIGWVIESSHPQADPDRGEVNNTGDVLETAMLLARWGDARYLDDAERILRAHLLPAQLRDTSFIPASPEHPRDDGERDIARRHLGAFGFPAPYGHKPVGAQRIEFNMDIVGGAVGSLCEAYRTIATFDERGHHVHLLFDHDTEYITIASPYTHDALQVTVKRAAPLRLRVPGWVDSEMLVVEGADAAQVRDGYLYIDTPPIGQAITIRFPLVERELALVHRTRTIRVRLRGDQVMAMDRFDANLTFFPPM